MSDPNVERMRHAIAKVEVLLHELDPTTSVEVLVEPPVRPADCLASIEDAEHHAAFVIESTVTEGFVTAETSDEPDAEAPTAEANAETIAGQLRAQVQTAEARADTAAESSGCLPKHGESPSDCMPRNVEPPRGYCWKPSGSPNGCTLMNVAPPTGCW